MATLVVLRFQLPHAALARLYGVDRSTITRAVHEVRPLLAARGFAVPGHGDRRLRTLADVFAHAAAEDVELRPDGTEVRVRGPRANKPGPRAYVSGTMRQNTNKATLVTDGPGPSVPHAMLSPTRTTPVPPPSGWPPVTPPDGQPRRSPASRTRSSREVLLAYRQFSGRRRHCGRPSRRRGAGRGRGRAGRPG
ncbi:transposase family protein [Streptomyces sp. NPDC098789]|uniref:helix-turn-helix domain-containing protein n=1 Tax=Streptomyces sp. NPDC098789 TaxID=3366098 RepID=UPI003824939B